MLTPRSIGRALEKDPKRWVLAIVALDSLLTVTSMAEKTAHHPMGPARFAFIGAAVVAPVVGLLFFVVRTRLVYWAGRALGGQARWEQIRAVDAWSTVPWMILALPLLPLAILTSLGESTVTPVVMSRDLLEGLAQILSFVLPVTLGYGAFLFTLLLAEVQQFSVWRSIFNQVLAFVLGIALPCAGIALGYGFDRLLS